MYLSKILSKSKGPMLSLLAIIIPSILGIWNFDFQKLSPGIELSSQAIYNIQAELTIWFLLIVVVLLSCVFVYLLITTIRDEKSLKKELEDTINSIKETVANNYIIHQRESLYPNISKAMDKDAASGFDIPQGSFTGRLFDISLGEISVFASIVHNASLSLANHDDISFSSPVFIELFNDLLIAHNAKIKNYHNSTIADLFDYGNSTIAKNIIDHFNKQAEIETKLRFKKLLSTLKVKNLSACNAMVFPAWAPVEKKKPIKHTYAPKKTI